eukprot:TRINITY_DN20764_c1_g1_i1.p1 TRINITY_DN20764_c1_g1~~TRINITY_DN20764_c1_g1_i1.p1  ORF type:complete len:195 (+),score=31.74 TRINITY_DN20764_c1_g1_i1:91-675(+)
MFTSLGVAKPQQQTLSYTSKGKFNKPSTRSVVTKMSSGFYDLEAKDAKGNLLNFSEFMGKVVLITNVACECGYTHGNYTELTKLYEKYGSQGLEVVAFPCNQFGGQEPGTNDQILDFVEKKYDVKFRMMDKINVNGPKTSPVWKYLKQACDTCSGDVRWNFAAKFLVDKNGNVVERNSKNPMENEQKIVEMLNQ